MRWAKSVLPICFAGFSLFAGCGDDDNSSAGKGAAAGEAGAAGAGGGDSTVGGGDTSTLGGSETSGGSGSMSEAGAATSGAAGEGNGGEDSCLTGGAQYDCETCQTVNQQPGGCCFDVVESCGDECDSLFECGCVGSQQPIAACVEACASDNDVSNEGASQFLAVMICTLGQQSTLAPGACGRACLDLPAPGCQDGGQEHADCDECIAIENAADGCCVLEATDCGSGTECGELVECKGQCLPGDFECIGQCEAAHPDGVDVERAFRVCVSGTTTDTGACGDACRPVECSLGGGNYGSCDQCENALVDSCCWAEFEACKAETGFCTSDSPGWEALQLCFVGDSEANPRACRIACGL